MPTRPIRLTALAVRSTVLVAAIFLLAGEAYCRPQPEPGSLIGITVRTDDGLQEIRNLPAAPKRLGSTSRKRFNLPGGKHLMLTVSRTESGDLDVMVTAEPAAGIRTLGAVVYSDSGEMLCGLLERVVDGGQGDSWRPGMTEALDLRGQKVGMFVKPTVSLYAPFFVSTGGYGVFVEGTWPGEYDMAASAEDEIRFEFEDPTFVFHILYGEPADVIRKYIGLTGRPILPPRWAFTPWRWRDEHKRRDEFFDGTPWSSHFNAEVVEDVLMMDALGIPCGVYWVDRPWAPGSRGYENFDWDTIRLSHPREMIEWLESRDIRFLLWIAPWVLKQMAWDCRDLGYAVEAQKEREDQVLVDFTNPEARGWWYGYVKKVINDGVVGFKLDRAEEIVPSDLETTVYSGITAREMHNDYPRLYAEAVHDLLSRIYGDEFIVMPRAGYAGSQRYAIFWGGDTAGTDWGLRSAIIALQRASVLGFNVWGSDTGGYHQGFNRETTARWLAFSAFCPLMEVGPTGNRGLWNTPWVPSYDVELIAIWSLYAQIHDRLGDYLYHYALGAHESGDPIARPLFVQFPDDAEARNHWDEYMLGDDVLACPIWESGSISREVYLPEGKWRDAWQPAAPIEGPAFIDVDAPLYKIPVYIRDGSDLDLGDLQATYDEAVARAEEKPSMADLLKKASLEQTQE